MSPQGVHQICSFRFGNLSQLLQGLVAELSRRKVHDTPEREIIIIRSHKAQITDHVFHLLTLEKSHSTPYGIGYLVFEQSLFDRA